MPSAEMEKDATFMITNNFLHKEYLPSSAWGYNTFGYDFSVTFWSRLEIAYSCTIFDGKRSPNPKANKSLFNQDRHFAVKLRLLKDGDFGKKWIPDLAVGVSDPMTKSGRYDDSHIKELGNGYFNRYYVAVSKHFNTHIGEVGGHLTYQYSVRKDGIPTGLCAAVTWEPIWLNHEDWFMNNFRATLEWDARALNFGINASIWKNRFEFMAMLFDMRYPMVGVRYKLVLKH